ncbi:iron transporter FeoA [Clostridia bacterium]|nr:iron transporter FeoA [Clostridia bacterium]
MRNLSEIKPGETVEILRLGGKGAMKRRIMDMGMTKGVGVRVKKAAPLGDPVEVEVRGYSLTMRKADMRLIEVS